MSTRQFSVRNLHRSRGSGYRLEIPRLDVAAGERIVITGPSGSGKSTALDLLGLTLRPDGADRFLFRPDPHLPPVDAAAVWRGNDSDRLGELRLHRMGYVLQTGGLLPFLTVRGNMELTARALKLPDCGEIVHGLAERLGLARLLDVMPDRLSVGERQRVAVGRALASRPAVILADEPTAALDPVRAVAVFDLLLHEAEASGTTLMLVTHDVRAMRAHGLRRLVVRPELADHGTVRAVLHEAPEGV